MTIRILPAAFFFLLVTACEKNNKATEDYAVQDNGRNNNTTEEYTVPVNNCVNITNVPGAREICLDSVVRDSRCPPGVVCVWEGEIICRFEVKTNSGSRMITLGIKANARNPSTFYPRQIDVFNMRIWLENVIPYVNHITYGDYKAIIKVTPI